MKRNIFLIIPISIILIAVSCTASREIEKNFTFKYGKENASSKENYFEAVYHLNSLLFSNLKSDISLFSKNIGDSIFLLDTYVTFYEDGIVCISPNYSKNLKEKDFIKNYWKYWYWGIYKKGNDGIIKLQCIKKSYWLHLNDNWDGYEVWFQLIEGEKIKMIKASRLYGRATNKEITYNKQEVSGVRLKNIEIPSNSNAWLKKEEWLWATKSDWENYMRRKTKKKIK